MAQSQPAPLIPKSLADQLGYWGRAEAAESSRQGNPCADLRIQRNRGGRRVNLHPRFQVTPCGASRLADIPGICYVHFMPATIDLEQMSVTDKLRLMEDLWADLSGKEVSSPDWHGDVLAERERLIESGEEKFVDWETAKRQLREEVQ